jgi:D-alanyl-D-alanine endopeptidase (penicillin-binding protein 7)
MTAIEHLFQQPAAQATAWALVQFVWQGALIGVLSAAALFALKRSAADVRYVVATIGLALMLTMPAVTAVQTWMSMTGGQGTPSGEPSSATPVTSVPSTIARAQDVQPRGADAFPPADARIPSNAAIGNGWVRLALLAWLASPS